MHDSRLFNSKTQTFCADLNVDFWSETNAIEHQREHFASLSKNLYEVLKGLKINTAIVYVQYCPMKKAYWLSESAAIKNPYYSDTMPTCGKTAATLAAIK